MDNSPRVAAAGSRRPTVTRLVGGDLDAWLSQRPEPALVLFDAPWSAACRLELGILVRLAVHFSGRLRIGALDAAAHRDLSRRFRIAWVPTLVLFDSGDVVARWEAARDADELIREVESALEGAPVRTVDPAARGCCRTDAFEVLGHPHREGRDSR